jgi:hypothetical protein
MKYRLLGKSGLRVSEASLNTELYEIVPGTGRFKLLYLIDCPR